MLAVPFDETSALHNLLRDIADDPLVLVRVRILRY